MLSGVPTNSAPPDTTVEFFRAGYRFDELISVFPDFRLDLLDEREECVDRLDFTDNLSSSSSISVDVSSPEISFSESLPLVGVSSTFFVITASSFGG